MKRLRTFAWAALIVVTISGARAGWGGQDSQNAQVAEHFRAGQQDLSAGRPGDAVREFQDVLRLDPALGAAHINLGLAYHLLGNYQLASAELRKGLEQNPNIPGANIVLGMDEVKLGSPGQAIEPLNRVLRLDPSNQEARRTLAAARLAEGNYLEAARAYRAAFHQEGKGADSWLRLGTAYLEMSNQLATRLSHRYSGTAWAYRAAGDLLSARQLWGDAARQYQLALARDPLQAGLHASLGDVYLEQGKLTEAEREYRSGIRVNPSNPWALLGLAEIALQRRNAAEALGCISQIVQVSPQLLAVEWDNPLLNAPPAQAAALARQLTSDQDRQGRPDHLARMAHMATRPGTHFLLAELYRAAGDTTRASQQRAAFEQELSGRSEKHEEEPLSCEAYHFETCVRQFAGRTNLSSRQFLMLGSAGFALKQYDKAGDAFASALALQKQNPEAVYWLVLTYSKLADDCFSQLTTDFPNSAQAHELRAETYKVQGQDAGAIREYQSAVALEPQNAALYEALGELYLNQHQLPQAGEALEKALEAGPTRPRSLYLMGRFELGEQRPDKAINYLEKALRYDPSLLEARASLGMAYLRAGKPALAVPQLQESASLDYYGDLHYMLYQAYRDLGQTARARDALATSQAMRGKTEARDQAVIHTTEHKDNTSKP